MFSKKSILKNAGVNHTSENTEISLTLSDELLEWVQKKESSGECYNSKDTDSD